jgi:hypothetical protein
VGYLQHVGGHNETDAFYLIGHLFEFLDRAQAIHDPSGRRVPPARFLNVSSAVFRRASLARSANLQNSFMSIVFW